MGTLLDIRAQTEKMVSLKRFIFSSKGTASGLNSLSLEVSTSTTDEWRSVPILIIIIKTSSLDDQKSLSMNPFKDKFNVFRILRHITERPYSDMISISGTTA